jgi:hypothetical protein
MTFSILTLNEQGRTVLVSCSMAAPFCGLSILGMLLIIGMVVYRTAVRQGRLGQG